MKVLGVFGGIGSMMIGAKKQGYQVIGNIEDRKYFFTGTFEYNFPGAFFVHSIDELTEEQRAECMNVDLIMGHPKCGSFSNMRQHTSSLDEARKELAGNFGRFIDIVSAFQPKFFAIDNLPRSLTEFNCDNWKERLPEYDIFFEYISNGNYGNAQKRKRLFVIGAKKELGFYFIPGEFEHHETLIERIKDIPADAPNHQQWKLNERAESWSRHEFDPTCTAYKTPADYITYQELIDNILKKQKIGDCIRCFSKKGHMTTRIGKCVVDVNKPARTITGGNAGRHYHFRSDTYMPLTIRERARIQGCPDDFVFLPNRENEIAPWHNKLIHQTGKFMPVEFTSFLTQQIKDFLEGKRDDSSYTDQRMVAPEKNIDENKYNYCIKYGYTNQEKVCAHCGSKAYCEAMKHNIRVEDWNTRQQSIEFDETDDEQE